jgi:hypothetical protein
MPAGYFTSPGPQKQTYVLAAYLGNYFPLESTIAY